MGNQSGLSEAELIEYILPSIYTLSDDILCDLIVLLSKNTHRSGAVLACLLDLVQERMERSQPFYNQLEKH